MFYSKTWGLLGKIGQNTTLVACRFVQFIVKFLGRILQAVEVGVDVVCWRNIGVSPVPGALLDHQQRYPKSVQTWKHPVFRFSNVIIACL